MQWDVKSADMKYLATMAKNEGVPLTQKRKRNDKRNRSGNALEPF